jgi:DNA-binding NarL/FixJ family response regulator
MITTSPITLTSSELNTPSPARIFLVDDHPLVREWLGSLLERQADFSVCGQAENAAAAFEGIAELQPNLAVIDLSLDGGSGLELIKQLQGLPMPPKVVVLSMHDETIYAERAIRAGAAGYVMKRAATGQVVQAIRQVLLGKLYLSEELSSQFAEKFVLSRNVPGESAGSLLSDREMEVFSALGRGRGTRHIAEDLHISPKTVQVYCGRIKQKLGLEDGRALMREAVRWVEQSTRIG